MANSDVVVKSIFRARYRPVVRRSTLCLPLLVVDCKLTSIGVRQSGVSIRFLLQPVVKLKSFMAVPTYAGSDCKWK